MEWWRRPRVPRAAAGFLVMREHTVRLGQMLRAVYLTFILQLLPVPEAFGTLDSPMALPAEMCRNYFFLPVTLAPREGYPQDRTLWFLHDTGASDSYVDPDSVERVSSVRLEEGDRAEFFKNAFYGTYPLYRRTGFRGL